MADESKATLMALTADIVAAHVSHNKIATAEIADLIAAVHGALVGLGAPVLPAVELKPAVPVRASVKPDHIVCLEDGQELKMLRRHLATYHQMTPDDYRKKWGLAGDYPMVAPAYAKERSSIATTLGLGHRSRAKAVPGA